MRAFILAVVFVLMITAVACVKGDHAKTKPASVAKQSTQTYVNDFSFPADWPLSGYEFPRDAVLTDLPANYGLDNKQYATVDISNGSEVIGKSEEFAFTSSVEWDELLDDMEHYLLSQGYTAERRDELPDLTPINGRIHAWAEAYYVKPGKDKKNTIEVNVVLHRDVFNAYSAKDKFPLSKEEAKEGEKVRFSGYVICVNFLPPDYPTGSL